MNKSTLLYGVLFGVLSFINGMLSMRGIYGTGVAFGVTLIILIGITIVAGNQYKKQMEGYASFGELIRLFLGIIFIGTLLSAVLTIAYFAMMSEEAKEALLDKMLQTQVAMFEGLGMPEEAIADAMDELEEQREEMLSPKSMLMASFINLVLYSLIALIPAALLRKSD